MTEIRSIPVTLLHPHPKRKDFHDVEGDQWELFKADIQRQGILVPLIVCRADNHAGYIILAGHQRSRAARALGMEKVPCIEKPGQVPEGERLDVFMGTNLARALTLGEKMRMLEYMAGRLEDGRKSRERDENGHFIHSAQNGPNGKKPRDQLVSMIPGLHRDDITMAKRIDELPEDVRQKIYDWIDAKNPKRKELKEKVNALNADRRKLKAEIRDLKKDRIAKRDMERVRDYQAARHDPDKAHQARTFDTVNRAINDACIQANTMVSAIFAAGKLTPDAARVLEPGVKALAIILEEQLEQLKTGWRNISRDLQDIGTHGEDDAP